MYFSSGFPKLDSLLGGGYADRSTILVTGQVAVGKEIVAYGFIQSGIREGDHCLYATRQLVKDVLRDTTARGMDIGRNSNNLTWIAAGGSDKKFQPDNLAKLSFAVKDYLKENQGKKTRILLDSLSSLLLTNSPDSVYRFLTQLFAEVKLHDACILAILEEDMHTSSVIASMEQIFDGMLRVDYGEGDSSVIEVGKMIGSDIPVRSKIVVPFRNIAHENKMELDETVGRRRIAVLPLVSFSPDPDDEFFADGLTEELIDSLCQVRELEVIARTSVMAYKNKEKKIAEIGWELRVGTLVEGSVRKYGNRIRVTAQLIDAKTEGHLWSSRYDNELLDIFAVQSDIAEKITEALKLNLLDAEKKEIRRKATPVPEAYIAYLNAVHFRYRANSTGLRKAVQYLNKAIELDPSYADAYAQLAINYTFLGVFWQEPSVQWLSKAKENTDRALELDPKNSEAYYAKCWVSYFYDMNWKSAEIEGRTAIEIRPSYAEPRITLAYLLTALGRREEALEQARRAVDLDPLGIYSHLALARVLSILGKFDEAIAEHNKAIEIEPNSTFLRRELGFTYFYAGKKVEGMAELEKATQLPDGEFSRSALGYGYAVSGRREEALKILAELQVANAKGKVVAYEIALIYSGLGENSLALDYLEQAYEEHSIVYLVLFNVEPAFANLRREARFKTLLEKMNLGE